MLKIRWSDQLYANETEYCQDAANQIILCGVCPKGFTAVLMEEITTAE